MTRREMLVGLGGILATGTCPAVLNNVPLCRVGKFTPANPYVTDGLVAMWDGEWNAGWGVHDANATVWKDLSGNGYDAIAVYPSTDKTPPVWGENSYVSTRRYLAFYWKVGNVLAGTSAVTVEVAVSDSDTNNYRWFFSSIARDNRVKIQRYDTAGTLALTACGIGPYFDRTGTAGLVNATMVYDGARRIVFRNGEQKNSAVIGGDYSIDASSEYTIAQEAGAYNTKYHSIRVYSRALTHEEIAANYAVDAARFNI